MKELLFSKTISCKYLDTADEEIEKAVLCCNFGFALTNRILEAYEEAYNNKVSETSVKLLDNSVRLSRFLCVSGDVIVSVAVTEFEKYFDNTVTIAILKK